MHNRDIRLRLQSFTTPGRVGTRHNSKKSVPAKQIDAIADKPTITDNNTGDSQRGHGCRVNSRAGRTGNGAKETVQRQLSVFKQISVPT